ncbi:hypothetical protein EHP00_2681 [Ecytonucleospora hepatopenaei]|uniref:Transposase Tc1-like domain-containing protein n=1 Tax=Ecytonucleospora hepatopenaei TaxID=646526 RepID=A0A1W0E8N8_9MICR|nr:hypothetical protein EHP00_2681 [Ecytonucleospora hepatopenaei]
MTWIQTKRITGRSRSTIYRVWNQEESLEKKSRPGRPRLISKRVLKLILKKSVQEKATCSKIIKELNLKVSHDTVLRAIRENEQRKWGKKKACFNLDEKKKKIGLIGR